jgi:siroheme synthase-like protein
VITPELGPDMDALSPQLDAVLRRPYREGDASPFRLVIAATGTETVDANVHSDAEAAGVWVNSADDRAHSSFILPAVHRDGALTVAVSTSGLSPALASWLRARIAAQSACGMGELAQLLGDARARLRQAGRSSETADWAGLLNGPLPELVAAGDLDRARALVAAATKT